ncbi:hypothetical protein [Streptomyces sp. NPDC055299]
MTALSDDMDDVTADSFVLDELGVVLLMARDGWNDACTGTALRGITHFAAQILADSPQDVTRTLEAMRTNAWRGPRARRTLRRVCTTRSGGGHRLDPGPCWGPGAGRVGVW